MAVFLTLTWNEVEDRAPEVLVILAVLIAVYTVFRIGFPPVARAAIMRDVTSRDTEMDRRADTIVHVVERTAGALILVIGAVTLLHEIGLDITAIVTGLGITGLAVALGAQALVRDAINGIFLLAEDQYRTGDVIRIADVTGKVESVSLRRTIIRDEDGVVHSVPNGIIGVVSNYTRDFARVNVRVQVAYGEDTARVSTIIERVGAGMQADPHLGQLLSEAPRATGIDEIGEKGVTMIVSALCKPDARREVAAELRGRLMEAFLSEGVRVPFAGAAERAGGSD